MGIYYSDAGTGKCFGIENVYKDLLKNARHGAYGTRTQAIKGFIDKCGIHDFGERYTRRNQDWSTIMFVRVGL